MSMLSNQSRKFWRPNDQNNSYDHQKLVYPIGWLSSIGYLVWCQQTTFSFTCVVVFKVCLWLCQSLLTLVQGLGDVSKLGMYDVEFYDKSRLFGQIHDGDW